MARQRKRIAFTLIELLVVIAIIALLVSILMPSLQQAKALAERAKCGVQLHNIGLAINVYCDDNDDSMPFGRYGYGGPELVTWLTPPDPPPSTQRLGLLFAKRNLDDRDAGYLDDREIIFCPGRKYPGLDMRTSLTCGYSYCVPNSCFCDGSIPSRDRYICYKRSTDWENIGWPFWSSGGSGPYGVWAPYVAWVACDRDDGTFPADSPHQNIGANVLYRNMSVKFIERPDTPEGWGYTTAGGSSWGYELGNHADSWPFWRRDNAGRGWTE